MRVNTITWGALVAIFCCCIGVSAQSEEAEQKELYDAIKTGNAKKVDEILDKSPGLAGKEIKYYSFPVIEAAKNKNLNSLKALVGKGANLKQTEPKTGNSVLHLIVEGGGLKPEDLDSFLEFIVKEGNLGIEVKNSDGASPLNHAFSYSRHLRAAGTLNTIVEAFAQHGADVNAQDQNGRTPIYHVVNLVQFKGMDKAKINNNVLSPIKLLVEKGAKVDIPARNKSTPLLAFLSRSGDVNDADKLDVVAFMMENGADPRARGEGKKRPLDYAERGSELHNLLTQKRKR